MKFKLLFVVGFVLVSVISYAQQVVVDVKKVNFESSQDSMKIEMDLQLQVDELNTKDAIILTPYIKGDEYGTASLSSIQINGIRKHALHERSLILKGKSANEADKMVISVKDVLHPATIVSSVRSEAWMNNSSLCLKKELLKSDGEIVSLGSDVVLKKYKKYASSDNLDVPGEYKAAPVAPSQSTKVVKTPTAQPTQTVASLSTEIKGFKGSFITPVSDDMDERNKKELNLSLDEAMFMAESNPQILSLRELYLVASAYANDKSKFYNIIDISVRLYPVHPTANLNAAAMAIEKGNADDVAKYLKMAPHESLEYKNCRGVYELMIGNVYEGIRLLRAAKEAGSEEADYNLKVFFKKNK